MRSAYDSWLCVQPYLMHFRLIALPDYGLLLYWTVAYCFTGLWLIALLDYGLLLYWIMACCFTGLWLPRNRIQTKYPSLAFLCKTHAKSGPFFWLKLITQNVTLTLCVDEWRLRCFWITQYFATIRYFSSPITVHIIIWITLKDYNSKQNV